MRPFLFVLCAFLVSRPAVADDRDLAKLFADRGIEGTMVLSSLGKDRTFTHNAERARQRLPSASTFKILHTLIALDRQAIAGEDEVLKWDGTHHPFPDWNRDQTLASAFRVSCVWCYQELARRVGAAAYRASIRQAGYGELREPFNPTEFWLDGSLRVSAIEQVDFLKQVLRQSLPYQPRAYAILRRLMLVEQTPTFAIRAKTGWATRSDPPIGWYVGYVETPRDTWAFATNLDLRDARELPLRQRVTRDALKVKGLIE